ncbi:MAG: SRPBCC family protein [Acidimicrobiales bacterium]
MDLHHRFEVAAGIDQAWPAFLDMPRIAPCMPGAEVTEVIDDRNVKGAAKVKVGPINLSFAGRAEMTEIDHDGHSALMVAKGADAKGRGNAEADVGFSLVDLGSQRTEVEVNTALNLTGSVAQYGRASGLIDEVANQLIGQFVENLEKELSTAGDEQPEAPQAEPADQPDATRTPAETGPETEAVSGLSLLFRAIVATVKKWFRRS